MATLDFLTSIYGLPIVAAVVILALPLLPRRRNRKHRGLRS